ncbi:5711_t:CDS:2, partial [Cetraspora pellucida]
EKLKKQENDLDEILKLKKENERMKDEMFKLNKMQEEEYKKIIKENNDLRQKNKIYENNEKENQNNMNQNVDLFILPCDHYFCIKCVSIIINTIPLPNSSTNIIPPPSRPYCRDEFDDEDKKLISEQIDIRHKLRNKRKERELNNIKREYAVKKIKLDNDEGSLKRKIKKSLTIEKSEA